MIVGTLFEVPGDITIHEVLTKVLFTKDLTKKDSSIFSPSDYRLVKLGSPNRVLENDQTFEKTHTENGDVFLIIKSTDKHK